MENKQTLIKNILKAAGILLLAEILLDAGNILGFGLAYPLNFFANPGIKFGFFYASFIGIWILTLGLCKKFKSFRNVLPKLGTKEAGNNLKTALLLGLPLGIGLNLTVGLTALMHKDIALSFARFSPLMLLYFIVVITIQSGAEELVTRCFIYEKLREYFPNVPAVAILANAIFFGAIHLLNPGITALAVLNIILVGILYSLVVYYYKSLWATIVAHASWNFCQNILLGLPNSGLVTNYSVFKLDAASACNSFTYHTAFGIEGTIMSCVLLTVACIAVYYFGHKKVNR